MHLNRYTGKESRRRRGCTRPRSVARRSPLAGIPAAAVTPLRLSATPPGSASGAVVTQPDTAE